MRDDGTLSGSRATWDLVDLFSWGLIEGAVGGDFVTLLLYEGMELGSGSHCCSSKDIFSCQ